MTLIRIYENLRDLGYEGSYAAVRRYAIVWRAKRASAMADAYVPLTFAPGEAYQFDWSHEIVIVDGVTTIVKVAHVRLCHSRMMFVRAYPRETQEMVFDAHERAFAFFKGACSRAVRTRGHFPTDEAAIKLLYLVLRQVAQTWKMPPREWCEAKTQFAIMFDDRFVKA